jgi:hypothetical protein
MRDRDDEDRPVAPPLLTLLPRLDSDDDDEHAPALPLTCGNYAEAMVF